MKKALIYDPYLDTLGGGERYALTVATTLEKLGFNVVVAWKDKDILTQAEVRFGLKLNQVTVSPKAYDVCHKSSIIERYIFTKKFNLCFWFSDGSIPFIFSKRNLLHFQVPFTKIGGNPAINKIKDLFINAYVYNSEFTEKVICPQVNQNKGFVLYPPTNTKLFKSQKKLNQIIAVGRFDSPSHSKRQDVLIDAFIHFSKLNPEYKLVLAGAVAKPSPNLEKLKVLAENFKIKFVTNPTFSELVDLYSVSKFFWHAAGFGVDEFQEPEKVEHFGITTVEAMASGCIPIVINRGGQKEIVSSDVGRLVEDPIEMSHQTDLIIKNNLSVSLSERAIEKSHQFSSKVFSESLNKIINA